MATILDNTDYTWIILLLLIIYDLIVNNSCNKMKNNTEQKYQYQIEQLQKEFLVAK
jgi:hypothetical protein